MREASCIHNDIFFLHHVDTLVYQALVPTKFASLFKANKSADICPEIERECTHILRQAEVAIRKSNEKLMVSVSSSARALWVYKFANSAPHSEESHTILETEIAPFTYQDLTVISMDVVKGVNQYMGPFLRAVNQYLLGTLIKMRQDSEYEFFGDNYIFNTKNGSLIASSIEIQSDASIYARTYTFKTNLHIPPIHKGCAESSHVVLLPIGCNAILSKNKNNELIVEPPNRKRAAMLLREMNLYYITNLQLSTLETSSWIRIKTSASEDVLWPVDLIRSAAVHEGKSEYSISNPLVFNYSIKSGKNAYKDMTQMMNDLKSPEICESPELPQPALYKTVNPPLGPPPSPLIPHGYITPGTSSISTPRISPGESIGVNAELLSQQLEAQVLNRLNSTASLDLPVDKESSGSVNTCVDISELPDEAESATPATTQAITSAHDPASAPAPTTNASTTNAAEPTAPNGSTLAANAPTVSDMPLQTKIHVYPPEESNEANVEPEIGPVTKKVKREDISPSPELQLNKLKFDELEQTSTEETESEIENICHAIFCNPKPWTLFHVPTTPAESQQYDILKHFLPQVIWDFGHMDIITNDKYFRYKVSIPSPYIVRQFKKIFPEFKESNIDSLLPSSDTAPKLQLLSPPLVNVHQEDERIKARIPILKFWKYLNLRPINPPIKLITVALAVNVPPVLFAFRNALHGLKDSYTKCGLGEITLPSMKNVVDGIMPVNVDLRTMSVKQISGIYEKYCMELLTTLKEKHSTDTKILILTGYPFKIAVESAAFKTAILSLTSGFGKIKSEFKYTQWISLSFSSILSESNDLLLSEHNFTRLALSAYGRFKPFFSLSNLIPHSAGLQYKPEAPIYLLEEEPYLYVSYLTINHRICLVSLTDQWAVVRHVEIIQNFDENGIIQFHKLISGVWKTAVAIAEKDTDKKYRFVFLKCGIMRLEEKSVWRQVKPGSVNFLVLDVPHLTGIKVTTDNDLVQSALRSDTRKSPMAGSSPLNSFNSNNINDYQATSAATGTGTGTGTGTPGTPGTPGTTDINNLSLNNNGGNNNNGGSSPESQNNYPLDAIITDKNDEVYGTSINGPEGYLSSGFLIKPKDEFYVVFETRLLLNTQKGTPPRSIVNKILGQFRRLASMSQATGVTKSPSLIPWNIIALAKVASAFRNLDIS